MLFSLAALLLRTSRSAVPSVAYTTTCAATEYYDASRFTCRSCTEDLGDANAVPDTRTRDANGNFIRCSCAAGYIEAAASIVCDVNSMAQCNSFKCTACGSKAPNANRTKCMTCPTTVDSATLECACVGNQAVVERDGAGAEFATTKQCIACEARTYVSASDPRTCLRCSHPLMTRDVDGKCTCDHAAGATGVAGMGYLPGGRYTEACLTAGELTPISGGAYDESLAINVKFTDGSTVNSIVFKHLYLWSATRCFQWGRAGDTQACEALANLCVLNHYKSTSTPCKLYSALVAARTKVTPIVYGWASSLPWLDYKDDTGSYTVETEVLWNKAVPTPVELNTQLTFYLARYTLNGTFVAMEPLAGQLSYCCTGGSENGWAAPTSTAFPWLFFGTNYKRSCSCDLRQLVAKAGGTMDLFELYLDDGTSSSATQRSLYPVPFRNENITQNNKPWPAMGDGTANDELHRRFFLYDVASGRAVEDGTAMATQGKPRMVRYADRIQLQVTLDSARSVTNNMGAINPPSISIRYQEVAFEKLGDVQTTLRVVYTMELTGWMVAQLCFYGAAAIIGFAYSALRITSFVSRNPTREMGALEMLPFAARALSYLFTSQSWPIFIASLPLTLFWMLFYKLTNRVFYMIPPNDMLEDYLPFRIAIHVAMVCQVLRMLEIIIGQSNLRLFFVDWDKARGKLQPIRKGKSMRQSQRDRDSKSGQMSSDDAVMAPLSIWRTLFAANEWSELQTLRSTSLELTLFGIMAILHGTGLENLSRSHPNQSDLTDGACSGNAEINDYLRYISTIVWWFVLWALQRLWKFLLSERLFAKIGILGEESPLSIFVDMCTLAKVSLVVLDEQYHGYYLHCCSPHEYGDCSMAELIDYLRTDQQELSTHRGLHWIKAGRGANANLNAVQKACGSHGPPQTFEFIASPDWKVHFESYHMKVLQVYTDAINDPSRQKEAALDRFKKIACCCVRTVDITLIDEELLQETFKGLTHFVSASMNRDLQNYPMKEEVKGPLHEFLGLIPKNWAKPTPAEEAQYRNVGFPSFLYPDKQGAMCGGMQPAIASCLFLGVEHELMLCNMLVFCVVDMWAQNMVVAAIACYAVERFMVVLRAQRGDENMAGTTLLDPRFLF